MHRSEDIFLETRLWESYGLTPDYQERIATVTELMPTGARTLLDVGCGKGEIIDHLATTGWFEFTVGTDSSPTAVNHLTSPRAIAMLPDLPFGDQSFDAVMCLQVLEHLENDVHRRAIEDIQRVARQYILLGVPYKENLLTKKCLCAECGRTSHVDGHVRSYDAAAMAQLLPGFSLRRSVLVGVLQKRHTRLFKSFERDICGVYYMPNIFLCPYCGSTQTKSPAGFFARLARNVFGILNDAYMLFTKPKPYWIIGLYERNTAGQP